MITTISFDGDNTLWDFEKVMRHSLECVRNEIRASEKISSISVEEMIAIRNEVAESLKGVVTDLEKIRLEAFKETFKRYDVNDEALAIEMNSLYLKHRFEDIELFSDVLMAFESLKKAFRLGLLSNGNSCPERCGLGGVFEFVILSQFYGVEKPDKKIFGITLSKAKCSSDEILHVGDSLRDDIEGAQQAGIKSVWINRDKKTNKSNIIPDFEINSLLELSDILKRLNKK